MKKVLLIFTIIYSINTFAQKTANGKIYIEHPAIEIVNQLIMVMKLYELLRL